jgi:hypothetical protein
MFLLFAFMILSSVLIAGDDVPGKIPNLDPNAAVSNVGNINVRTCPAGVLDESCPSELASVDRTVRSSFFTSSRNNRIPVSLISWDFANELFQRIANAPHIPFRYPDDGCYARAHEMTRILQQANVISAKVFLEGDLRVETRNSPAGAVTWWYHVAPIIKVNRGGVIVDMVFDPSIFSRPVTLAEWSAIQTRHSTGRTDAVYFTNRFNYHPGQNNPERSDYDQNELASSNATLAEFLRLQNIREGR